MVVSCWLFIDESSSVTVCIGGGGVEVVVAKAGSDVAVIHHRLVNTIIVLVNKKCIGK